MASERAAPFDSCGHAVGEGELLVHHEVSPHGHAQQDAQHSRAGEPKERLMGLEREREAGGRIHAQQVERRHQRAQEGGLACRGARGLNDVVLPAVEIAEREPECQVAEEGRDHGDVRSEAELEHDVGVGTPDHRGDQHRDDDRA